MCGIAGMIDWRAETSEDALISIGRAMNDALFHRGPDSGDVWVDASSGIVLGQRRLAIIDLSPGGAQPMHSADGRYVINFNGEIYNYAEIRAELQAAGRGLSTQSDTEVLLEACALWGVEAAVRRTIGMFAIMLWDRATGTITLARDRLGVKPLYYAADAHRLIFASQLKAFRAVPGWAPTLDRDAIAGYLRHAYIGQPRSIYQEASKLAPGHIMVWRRGEAPRSICYWDIRDVAAAGQELAARAPMAEAEAIEHLDVLLRDAVRLRLIADVPVGAFLSGGIDSSTVAALMQAVGTSAAKTFSIGFREQGYDEAGHAAAVARHLHTDHTEFYVEPHHALDVIPQLPEWFDEPFADVSQIPSYLVSKLTRSHVTVALSGDGGDEVFAGYNRHLWGDRLAHGLATIPGFARQGAASLMRLMPPATLNHLAARLPRSWLPSQPGDKLEKLAGLIGEDSTSALYRRMISQWQNPDDIVVGGAEAHGLAWDSGIAAQFLDFVARMQVIDTATYLPDDILTKVDRATMAVGLEGRVPLLDHRVVEFAWSLPKSMKLRDGQGKWVLRQVLDRYVPRALIDRPKMGFGVPIDAWLRGPLREWAEGLLDAKRLADEGLLKPAPIRRAWAEHLSGAKNWQYPLWTVLMLQAWSARWR
jgi:asparagine synthase (glutamine-hydrolysing)